MNETVAAGVFGYSEERELRVDEDVGASAGDGGKEHTRKHDKIRAAGLL